MPPTIADERRSPTPAHRARLQEIMAVAAEQFYVRGYAATDVRSIADQVGLHVSSLYTYVSGKEEVLFLIMQQGMRDISAAFDAALENSGEEADSLRAVLEAHIVHHARRRYVAQTSRVEMRSLSGEYKDAIVEMRGQYERRWLDLITSEMKAGRIIEDDPKLLMFMLLSVGQGVARWYNPEGRFAAEEIAQRLAGFALDGLRV